VTAPASLVINSPYVAPTRHWVQARDGTLELVPEQHAASYEIFGIRNNARRAKAYIANFLIRLANGKTLVLEIKGEDSQPSRWVETRPTFDLFGSSAECVGGLRWLSISPRRRACKGIIRTRTYLGPEQPPSACSSKARSSAKAIIRERFASAAV